MAKFSTKPRSNWSRIVAFAWSTPQVLNDLKKDPKTTITELAKGGNGNYKSVDGDTAQAAKTIQSQTDNDPGESYRGYLPIPNRLEVGALADLDRSRLADLLSKGIAGILEFDEDADLWADELIAAWKDRSHLIAVLQDPAINLIHKDKLKSILPLPDRPRGLEELEIDKLQKFLGDQDHMEHLGGIFLFGS
jgi:hypothetical protein